MVDLKENVYLRRGEDGRDHIPTMPFWLALLRVAQFVFTLLVLILDAYACSVFGVAYYAGYGLAFFMFAWTILFLAYIFITPFFFPKAYNYWAQLAFEIFTLILWLTAFATLAAEAAAWSFLGAVLGNDFITGVDSSGDYTGPSESKAKSAINATKAAAGMGAIVWLLFIVTLIVFSVFLHKHRQARGKIGTRRDAPQPDVEANAGEKPAGQVELNQYPQQQQTGYPQQQYPQQGVPPQQQYPPQPQATYAPPATNYANQPEIVA